MKKVECIIPHKKFPELEIALRQWGISGITVSEVRGFGNEQTRPDAYLYLPKLKLEIYCGDAECEDLIAIIFRICRTGNLGDGKVAVFDVHDIVRIRTGERGEVAV